MRTSLQAPPQPDPLKERLRELEEEEAQEQVDSEEGAALIAETQAALRARNIPLFPISAHTHEGLDRLLEALWRRLEHFSVPG